MGILGVGTRDATRRFSQADAGLLEAFANLAALALRNAESFAERTRQARIQRGFYRIAAVLGQPISRKETFDALAQAASDALGGGSAAVLMPREDDLRLDGLHNLPGLLVHFLEQGLGDPSGPLRSAARNGRVLAAPRLEDDERFDEEWRRRRPRERLRRAAGRAGRGAAHRRVRARARLLRRGAALHRRRPRAARNLAGAAAARSSEASCSRPSAAPAAWRSSSRTGSLLATSWIRQPCSTRSRARRRRCSRPTRR